MNNTGEKNIIGVVVVILIIVGVVYFLLNKTSSMNNPSQGILNNQTPSNQTSVEQPQNNQTTNQQTPAPQMSETINIQNFAFSPEALTVKQGTTVTWVNNDTVGHSIKSDTFNSSMLGQGEKFQFTFNDKGTFDYTCGIHPSMTGQIVVQ